MKKEEYYNMKKILMNVISSLREDFLAYSVFF